jgi:hypothetical protein
MMHELNDRDALLTRVLDDGRVVDVFPLTFGRARITISAGVTATDWTDGW